MASAAVFDPTAYAAKRRQQLEKAQRLREERKISAMENLPSENKFRIDRRKQPPPAPSIDYTWSPADRPAPEREIPAPLHSQPAIPNSQTAAISLSCKTSNPSISNRSTMTAKDPLALLKSKHFKTLGRSPNRTRYSQSSISKPLSHSSQNAPERLLAPQLARPPAPSVTHHQHPFRPSSANSGKGEAQQRASGGTVAIQKPQPTERNSVKVRAPWQPVYSSPEAEGEGEVNDVSVPRIACPECGRKFVEEALDRHSKICKKVFGTKRREFNSTAVRVRGTEAAKFVKIVTRGKAKTGSEGARVAGPGGDGGGGGKVANRCREDMGVAANAKPAWKRKSDAFQQAMRAARGIARAQASGIDLSLLPPPPPEENLDYVQCPTCLRRFNEKAAERHISKCRDIIAKPKPLMRSSTTRILERSSLLATRQSHTQGREGYMRRALH